MKKNLKKTIILSMLISIFYLFSYFNLNFQNIKITIQSLPMFVGAIIFGPIDGLLIGSIGMFLNQLFGQYGLSITTIFWIIPYSISGFICGIILNNSNILNLKWNTKFFCFSFLNIIITILNTVAFYIDSKYLGYYNFNLVFGMFIFKLLNAIILGIIYSIVVPYIINIINKNK